jgi:predicted nucleic acid-binding protein
VERVCIDTSVWIEYFRRKEFTLGDQVDTLILEERVLNCGPVEFELLHGARKEELSELDNQLGKLDYIEMTRQDFKRAAQLGRAMKARGKTMKFVDLAIAAFCLERNLFLLTLDQDFKDISGLKRLAPNL